IRRSRMSTHSEPLQSGGGSTEPDRPIRQLAGGPGFEPELIGPEPIGLPLPHPPTGQRICYYSTTLRGWQAAAATFFAAAVPFTQLEASEPGSRALFHAVP